MAAGLPEDGVFRSEVIPLAISVLPLAGLVHRLRNLFSAKRQLFEELRKFDLGSAQCTEVFDSLFVHSAIQSWYGSPEEFESFVKGPLLQEVSGHFSATGNLPFAYCLLLATAPVTVTIDETISLWLGGAPGTAAPWQKPSVRGGLHCCLKDRVFLVDSRCFPQSSATSTALVFVGFWSASNFSTTSAIGLPWLGGREKGHTCGLPSESPHSPTN